MTGIADRKAEGGPFTKPVIGIATSAGGLSALSQLLGALPPTLDAAILIVQHLDPDRPSHLAEILGRRTPLTVKPAASEDRLYTGAVFIAPPGAHILVDSEGSISLSDRPPVHFVRPAADHLFESIAGSFGRRAVAVVLTNRRGKPMRVKVTCTQLTNPKGGKPEGVILLMEENSGSK